MVYEENVHIKLDQISKWQRQKETEREERVLMDKIKKEKEQFKSKRTHNWVWQNKCKHLASANSQNL